MTLKALDVDVINFILSNNSATIEELCHCFDVSQVNIRTILSKIEKFIIENKLGALLKEGSHYYFENNKLSLNFDYKNLVVDDIEKKERILYIILKLILEKSINLTTISKELNISRITLNSDIEFIKELIKDFDLKLISVQWRGVFFEGEPQNLQKFCILFISKLYIENYFSSNLKKIVNPVLFDYFRKFMDEKTEQRILNIANKLYNYFNIRLSAIHYNILVAFLVYIYFANTNSFKIFQLPKQKFIDLSESLDDVLDPEDKEIIGNNTSLIMTFLSQCINKKYSISFPIKTDKIVNEIYKNFNLKKNSDNFEIFSFFINDIYFKNRFFIPNYIKFDKTDEIILNDDISKTLINIFEKYELLYSKKDIALLYRYIHNLLTECQRKSVLIIDESSLSWKGNMLKNKLEFLEKISSTVVISYFNFKFFPVESFNKYDIFIFIDLPIEKSNSTYTKSCYFLNSYELLKNILNLPELM